MHMLIHVDTSSLATERVSFRDFANALLNDESFRARIREAKQRAEQNGLPALRSALNWNTCDRIRAVMIGLYHTKLPATLNKTRSYPGLLSTLKVVFRKSFPVTSRYQLLILVLFILQTISSREERLSTCELTLLIIVRNYV